MFRSSVLPSVGRGLPPAPKRSPNLTLSWLDANGDGRFNIFQSSSSWIYDMGFGVTPSLPTILVWKLSFYETIFPPLVYYRKLCIVYILWIIFIHDSYDDICWDSDPFNIGLDRYSLVAVLINLSSLFIFSCQLQVSTLF